MDAFRETLDIEFSSFTANTNIIFVIDHAGRAGNGFFQTIFDQHPQVIACPWMHYVYSYIITACGEHDQLDAHLVWETWRESRYFSLLYHDLDDGGRRFVRKFGGDPDSSLDRSVIRATFDALLLGKTHISRKDLIAAMFFSYARGLGRDTGKIRYILSPDSISLRFESAMSGFSGKVVDFVIHDFPSARLIHLERDPRAGFASTNHQFVNQLGNMYGLKPGQFWRRLLRLLRCDFDWDSVFVFGFLLIYFRQTFRVVMRKRSEYPEKFITVLNEDLNLSFVPTMQKLAKTLDIDWLPAWTNDFRPTMLGREWTGTGAYNSQYQTSVHGPLKNDPDHVARSVSGPNAYVTQRWRSRLKKNEIFIVERLLAAELRHFDYEFVYSADRLRSHRELLLNLWAPLNGEMPSLLWLSAGARLGGKELFGRLFYTMTFPVFYISARLVFLGLIKRGRMFSNDL